ncbi:amidohydrolase family protein [Ruegeria sp. SCP11]|uniref:amidohydrolase family protein n=1 Tax=Ruegeria sp. SCP11 TaxID=3141378 RepID=UPI00333832F6
MYSITANRMISGLVLKYLKEAGLVMGKSYATPLPASRQVLLTRPLCQSAMSHVSSMIAHGVFEFWPSLKFVVIECGVAWVAPLMWRLDADFKALRKETPWLKRLPSEYMKSHIRFTTQPLEEPENRDHLWSILDAMDGRNTLMFASDYPHWDYDDMNRVHIPDDWRPNVMGLNALDTYTRLPQEKATAS